MLHGEALIYFNELASHKSGTTNSHLKHIKEGLLGYIFPINALYKQKRAVRRAMRKSQSLLFKFLAARLTEINNYLPLLPGSSESQNMAPEELNEILLHVVTNRWTKKKIFRDGT